MTAVLRTAIGMALAVLLIVGIALSVPDSRPALAHDKTTDVPASGAGRCPSGVRGCTETWTHVNYWTHYRARVPANCTVEIIDQCGITVIATAAKSRCRNTDNCAHGPHDSTPRPTGPGTWTRWNGHRNINYRWSGQRRVPVNHDHRQQSPPPATPTSTPTSTPATPTPATPTPESTPSATPKPKPTPVSNPCANGGCLPPCMTDRIPGNCPWESDPNPEPKVCTTAWSDATRQRLLSSLRWESIVPYERGFTGYHHPETPGGQIFLTAASAAGSPVRHWIAQRPGQSLDVVDAAASGCRWTAKAVGVLFRELLPYEPSDLAKLRSPGSSAAAGPAQQAAALWDRLDVQRKQWFQAAFPRTDPPVVWCSPADLPPWTIPADRVLSLTADWEDRYGRCRWAIPRRGFWEWQLQVKYTSGQGGRHTEVLASDLSWFREPTGYLGPQATLW